VCVLAGAVAVALGISGRDDNGSVSAGAAKALPEARAANRPTVLFRSLAHRSQVVIAPAAQPSKQTLTGLHCDRVYFAGGRGLCLKRGGGFAAGYRAEVFGPNLQVSHALGVTGIPSRARVSPDGRYGAVTLFVTGHAYSDPGSFSTQTTLIDMATGAKIADLEQFTVFRAGRQVTAVDVNYWGVTFARDSDRFYATLATGGRTYLIEGSVGQRRAHVIHENVECPSLSPDGTRIAYKKRTGSASAPWHLTVLDLATMRETPVSDARSVDDQAEWLDDAHVLYGVDGAVWEANAGTGEPRRYLARADSPAAVRWSAPPQAPAS
jgi:hypothetical protein